MEKKSPAFQFYPNDWLSSPRVAMMTPAMEGAYIRLLAYAWMDPDCSIPDDDDQLAVLSRMGEGWLKGGSTVVKGCFKQSANLPGRLVHERLLEEREKQSEWRRKSSEGGKRSGKTRRKHSKLLSKIDKNEASNQNEPPFANGSKGGSRVVEPNANSSSSSSDEEVKEKISFPSFVPTAKKILEFKCQGAGEKNWTLDETYFLYLQDTYPDLDILAELKKARAYYDANGLKTARGMKPAIITWLNNAIKFGGGNRKGSGGYSKPAAIERREFGQDPITTNQFRNSIKEVTLQ